MRDWIAGAIGLLGSLLVLGGAATILSRAWFNRPPAEEPASTASTPSYGVGQVTSRLARKGLFCLRGTTAAGSWVDRGSAGDQPGGSNVTADVPKPIVPRPWPVYK